MNIFFKIYILSYVTACLCALLLYFRNRHRYAFSHKDYWTFLFKPWKIITFIIAAASLTLVAPYSGDYTWDYYDAFFMSLLTFLTAPWAIGILYRFKKDTALLEQAFVALCIWMFSASWSYDLYMLFREGQYPPTWLPNIILSSILYACAGLLWNLDWRIEKGIFMSFKAEDWPTISHGFVFHKIFIAIIPYVLIVIILCSLIIFGFHAI